MLEVMLQGGRRDEAGRGRWEEHRKRGKEMGEAMLRGLWLQLKSRVDKTSEKKPRTTFFWQKSWRGLSTYYSLRRKKKRPPAATQVLCHLGAGDLSRARRPLAPGPRDHRARQALLGPGELRRAAASGSPRPGADSGGGRGVLGRTVPT